MTDVVVGSSDWFGLFDVVNVRHDHLLHRMIDPVIENELIAHELGNLSAGRICGANVRHQKRIGGQFVNQIQDLPLSPLALARKKIDRS